ncbi:hypothetical protein BaRGS_00030562, partial [Batillaria attramentaria]
MCRPASACRNDARIRSQLVWLASVKPHYYALISKLGGRNSSFTSPVIPVAGGRKTSSAQRPFGPEVRCPLNNRMV